MQSRAQNKNKLSQHLNVRLFLLIMLFVMCGAYIWQINSVATRGYYLKDLERKIEILDKRNAILNFKATNLKSLTRVETQVREMGLVKIDAVQYLATDENSVAYKP